MILHEQLSNANILIIDDEPDNTRLLERALRRSGYLNIHCFNDARAALRHCTEHRPDLVLLDLLMPYMDGYQLLEQLPIASHQQIYLPVLVLTADVTVQARQRALANGASDFVTKPLSTNEVLLRIHNLLETRLLHQEIYNENQSLEERVTERTNELELAQRDILLRLAHAAEYRDDDTGQHTQRVGLIAARIAAMLGLPAEQVDLIRWSAPLHDLGKIGVGDAILLKAGSLSADELTHVKRHAQIGAEILAGSRFPLLQLAKEIALTHHEWWDGRGYPAGTRGEATPIAGRIVAVADAFDVMTHDRAYRNALNVADAVAEIANESGTRFDPQVVAAFLKLVEQDRLVND